jgi:NAD(P)-dependent dehydrogenase (short-subunit alcohol dehydrogenase family)
MSSGTHDRVWLITGASSGFGRALGEAALAAGDSVVGVFELHFFGPAALTRAALPHMRRQGSGWVVQMSSVGGQVTAPGFGAYCATKFALEGLTETLSQEVEFARFLIVEPGALGTDLFARDPALFSESTSEYEGTVGPTREYVRTGGGSQPGDPATSAQAIIAAITAEHPPLRLVLGADAVDGVDGRLRALQAELAEWQPRPRLAAGPRTVMSGRVVAVTGANRGIGREVARQLAAAGDIVILTARDRTKAATAADALARAGGTVVAYELDLTSSRRLKPSGFPD